MTYDFLLKAKSNPDLQDFCDYLIKPLQILEELEYRYKSLPLNTKVKPVNMMTHLKIDKMLNQYLPNAVDNYCDFSFKYRNENFVKTVKTKDGEVSYTAKDVLLQNLSKLIEEIHVLEEEFNENNKFKLLVQEKILINLGYATDLDKTPAKIVLENKFKYKAEDIFKKPVKELTKEIKKISLEKNEVQESKGKGISFVEFLLVCGVILVIGSIGSTTYSKLALQIKTQTEVVNLDMLASGTKLLYLSKGNYVGLNNKIISSSGLIPYEIIYGNNIQNIFGGTVNIKQSANPSEFDIVYENVPESACTKLVQEVNPMFSKIMIGAYTIKDFKNNIVLDPLKLYDVCNLNSTKKAEIIFTSN